MRLIFQLSQEKQLTTGEVSMSEFEKYQQMLEQNPEDTLAFNNLCTIAEQKGDFKYQADLMMYRAQISQDLTEVVDLYFRAGEVFLDKLNDLNAGAGALLAGFEKDPTHGGIGDRLDAIYRDARDWDAAYAILHQRITALSAADRSGTKANIRSDLHQQLGELFEKQYQQQEQALEQYRKAIELDKTNIMALRGAREIYLQQEKFKHAAKLCELEARVERATDRKVALYRELATLLSQRLNEPTNAVVALKRALKADANNADVKMELALGIAASPLTEESAKDHKWASEQLLKSARDTDGAEGVRLAALALQAFPESAKAAAMVAQKGRDAADLPGVLSALTAAEARLSTLEQKLPVVREIIKTHLVTRDLGEALKWAQLIAPVGSDKDRELLAKLEENAADISADDVPTSDVFDARESAPPPSSVSTSMPKSESVSTRAPAALPESAADMFAAVTPEPAPEPEPEPETRVRPEGMSVQAWVDELHLQADKARRAGDDAKAEERMLDIIDVEPYDQKASTYLERRFRARSDWSPLRELLLKANGSPHLPVPVQIVRIRDAARISEEQLSDLDGAINAWKLIKELDPKVRDAVDSLKRLYSEDGRWDDLIALLNEEVETTKSRTKKIECLRRLAEIYRVRLSDASKAATSYKELLDLVPDDAEAIENLDELYLREQQYEELISLLDRRVDMARDKDQKRLFLLRIAETLRERLDQPEMARDRLQDIMEMFPKDAEVLGHIESIDIEVEDWVHLSDTLTRMVALQSVAENKVDILKRLADVALLRLNDTKAGIRAWRQVLDLDKNDEPALEALSRLYEEEGEWDELVNVLRMRVAATASTADQCELHRKMALTLDKELQRSDDAAKEWQAILAIAEDAEAMAALAAHYERNEDWASLVDILNKQAPLAESYAHKADLLYRRAEILLEKLDRRDDAIAALNAINTDVDPTHVPTMGRLRDELSSAGQYAEAAEILEKQIEYSKDNDELKSLWELMGTWQRDELKDLARAMEAFEKAAALDLSDDALLDALDAVFVERKEWDKLLKMMFGRFQRSEDEDFQFETLKRGALICEEELQDTAQAWAWYRQMFDNLPHIEAVVPLLEEAGARMALWKELLDLYGVLLKGTEDVSEQVGYWLKISAIFETHLDDTAQALESVLRAFGLEPENREMLDVVDRLAVTAQAWPRLGVVYNVLASRAAGSEERIDLHSRHATVLFEKGEQAALAFDTILLAFEIDFSNEELLARVEEIGLAAQRYEDLVRVIRIVAEKETDEGRQLDLLFQAANIQKEHLEDSEAALDSTLDAFAVRPFDAENIERVWEMVRTLEGDLLDSQKTIYWHKFIASLRDLQNVHRRDNDHVVELLMLISRVYGEELNDPNKSFGALKDAQQLVPTDEATLEKLEQMAGRLDMWDDLVEHYKDILDETFEMNVAVMYHRHRARILADELDRSEDAAEHYWQIIQLDAQDERAYQSLLDYYEKAAKWNDLVNLLERQMDSAESPERKQELLLQIAGIWEERIQNRYEAKDWYEQIITIWPDNEAAKAALERLANVSKIEMPEGDDEEDEDIQKLVSIPPMPYDGKDDDDDAADAEEAGDEGTEGADDSYDADAEGTEDAADSDDADDEGTEDADDSDDADTDDADDSEADDEEVDDADAVDVDDADADDADDADDEGTEDADDSDDADDADDADTEDAEDTEEADGEEVDDADAVDVDDVDDADTEEADGEEMSSVPPPSRPSAPGLPPRPPMPARPPMFGDTDATPQEADAAMPMPPRPSTPPMPPRPSTPPMPPRPGVPAPPRPPMPGAILMPGAASEEDVNEEDVDEIDLDDIEE
ncbi:MAG: hypothetical protein M0R76_03225 [Proteobacteria bacterium]|nr:hypothetical protein [Pseudomonadota bacterium]